MSEPPTLETDSSFLAEQSTYAIEEKTQPTEEIKQALEQLKAEQHDQHTPPQKTPPPPPSEWELTRARLRDNPHETRQWEKLVELAESGGDLEQIKETYEALLEMYPNTSSAQIAYLNHFLHPESFQFAQSLFKGYLKTSPSVDLWEFYLTYVRRVHTGSASRDVIRQSYEFALNRVGHDKESGKIWADYINFLKSGETTSTWEEQQKMDALRKVYHRAVQIPLDNVETLWSELETFENNLNKITAKKFMGDLSPSYMQARTVLRVLNKHLAPLFPPLPPSRSGQPALYLPPQPTFNQAEKGLVGFWKTFLKYEESNPLEIDEKDKSVFISRVQGVYRKAVIRMRFFAEIWYMAYVWTNSIGKPDEAQGILKAGIEANPSSFVLNFAYAEVLEGKKEYAEVHNIFEKFLEVLRKGLEAVEARVNSANSSFSSQLSTDTQPANGTTAIPTGEGGIPSTNSSFTTQVADEKPPKSQELADRRTEYGIVWIMYMRFARRAEGLKSSRAVFGKARRDRWAPWEVYEAAALMEYHTSKTMDVASRIFEKGLDLFGEEIEYVLRYLGFLISVNDENNARAVFERVITSFPPDRARPLWERWARYEYQYGDLEAAQKLEKRIAETYPKDPPIKRFAQRHTYLGTDAIASRDLGFSMTRHVSAPGAVTSSSSNGSLQHADTVQLLLASTSQSTAASSGTSHKRPASPDHRKREEPRGSGDYGAPHKRARPASPPPPRERDRERWDGPPRRRFGSPPGWVDRDRDVPPPRRNEREREEEKGVALPSVVSWFIGQLPSASVFDGPVFRTDDLMLVFRNAVIPSSSASTRPRSPPPAGPPSRGRPPPDYGPYQGPGGSRGGRRY